MHCHGWTARNSASGVRAEFGVEPRADDKPHAEFFNEAEWHDESDAQDVGETKEHDESGVSVVRRDDQPDAQSNLTYQPKVHWLERGR